MKTAILLMLCALATGCSTYDGLANGLAPDRFGAGYSFGQIDGLEMKGDPWKAKDQDTYSFFGYFEWDIAQPVSPPDRNEALIKRLIALMEKE